MTADLDISIIIATHNRAAVLRQTLAAMTRLDRGGLNVQWVVVNNNSTDDTAEVIAEFQDELPLRYLFEEKPGKNCALNRALREGDLGAIVVFTDDDVVPDPDWLRQVQDACREQPAVDVFGGRVEVLWNGIRPPRWTGGEIVDAAVFGRHVLEEGWYPDWLLPFGANFWIRRRVLELGFRYNEAVGPRPKNRIMGGESAFLRDVRNAGHRPWFVPAAVVWHQVDAQYLDRRMALTRGFRLGRSIPHLWGMSYRAVWNRSQWVWAIVQSLALVKHGIVLTCSSVGRDGPMRFERQFLAIRGVGAKYENLRLWCQRAMK